MDAQSTEHLGVRKQREIHISLSSKSELNLGIVSRSWGLWATHLVKVLFYKLRITGKIKWIGFDH